MTRRGRPPLGPTEDGQGLSRISREEELTLAATVARAHYLDDQPLVKIAASIGVSRFQAARLLQLARQSGIVHIEVRQPGGVDRELSALLQDRLRIAGAIVVSPAPSNSPLEDVGATLAQQLSEAVQPGDVVGLSWSRAIASMALQLDHLESSTIVQLAGHIGGDSGMLGGVEIVRRTAQLSGGGEFPIYVPLVVPDSHTAASLLRQAEIAAAFERYDHLDVAVVSIGAWLPSGSAIFDMLTESERRRARDVGVVGEMSGRLFNGSGELVPDIINDRVIGISLEQLKRTPTVIASSYGSYRAAATIAAAKASLFTMLIADRNLALAILEAYDE